MHRYQNLADTFVNQLLLTDLRGFTVGRHGLAGVVPSVDSEYGLDRATTLGQFSSVP